MCGFSYRDLYRISLLLPNQHVAQTLLEFNGGASCVQVYVNQHDFFINRVTKVGNPDEDAPLLVLTYTIFRLKLN
jgi:hypothetical protein